MKKHKSHKSEKIFLPDWYKEEKINQGMKYKEYLEMEYGKQRIKKILEK